MKINISAPTRPEFDGDFEIKFASEYASTDPDRAYIAILARVRDALIHDESEDAKESDVATSALIVARREARTKTALKLRREAEEFDRGELAPEIAAENALVIKGIYRAELERIAGSLFVVQELFDFDNNVNDLRINVARDLPRPNDVPSQEKQALFVAINNASSVIRTVCQRMRDRAGRFYFPAGYKETERVRAIRLQDQYVRKLVGIARLGLEGPHNQLANLALDSLRGEFVAQEAGRVKNTYVRSLGVAAGIAASLFLGLYGFIEADKLTAPFWTVHKPFLIAGAGAAIGAWLSFSIRRVDLSFNDLAVLEEDRLDPSVRIVFVVGLTITACLLFWTKAMNIEIGSLKTANFHGSTAFLVGLFSGIAERALATAISGRATSFVRGVGGGG